MAEQDWTSQMRRGAIELCVLHLLKSAPNYGYAIVEKLQAFGPVAAGENTIYPLLRRLRAEGALEAFAVESGAGPPRQYLKLSAAGVARLEALRRDWSDLSDAVCRCLNQESANAPE